MGLFDMFGGGGGSLAVQAQSLQVSAGGTLVGAIAFQGGSKAQQVTNVKVKLVLDQKTTEMAVVNGQKVAQERSHARDVFPYFQVTGEFQSTPGQVSQFPFSVQLPTGLPNSVPNQVTYRLVATADIDNAIDPGAHLEIQVVGGVDQPVQQQAQPAPMKQQQAHAGPGHQQKMDHDPYAKGGAPDPYAKGAKVDPYAKGGAPDPYAKGGAPDPYAKGGAPDPYAKGGAPDPYAKGGAPDPYAKGGAPDPYAKGGAPDPYAKGAAADPYAKGGAPDPYAKGAPASGAGAMQIGTPVHAQHPSGQWYPGRIVAMQNGMIGVDWDDAKIGESTWVQPQQIRAK